MNKKQALPWDNPRFRNWVLVARACQVMQLTIARALQPLDLKPPHLDILANLYRYPGLTQQELARRMLVGRSNMSMLLPQLEKRGLLDRRSDRSDRRVLRLALTAEGEALTERALALQVEIINRSMEAATPDECDRVGDVMARMIERLTDAGAEAGGETGEPALQE